uniref:CDENN domain-containing protein n=1 Tax=Parascaris equorum TaxID=6256 RepID=A0A914R5E3_PAREQ
LRNHPERAIAAECDSHRPHTFVPVLPEQLIEYLESPTPYIMGLLHSVRNLNVELDTTIVVDLDIGAVYIPPTVTLPLIPEPFAQRFICSLQMVCPFIGLLLERFV